MSQKKEPKEFSAMLYALADEIDSEEGCVTESSENVRAAAERLDLQTVTIYALTSTLERILENDGADGSKRFDALKLYDARVDARTIIASVKGSAQ